VFSIAAYLRQQGHRVDALDAGVLNYTWKEFGTRIYQGNHDLVIIVCDFDVVEGTRRAADYVRGLNPAATVMTVGRLTYQTPVFFQQYDLDVIAESGDYEAAATEVIRWIDAGRPDSFDAAGLALRTTSGWKRPLRPGHRLDPDLWVFPDVRDIPYHHYDHLYRDDQNKFCGIPQRRELVVPVARGCPIGCEYCDVPPMQGRRERRVPVERVIAYIQESAAAAPFEYVAFYAPTFTLDRKWVLELCRSMIDNNVRLPWKCATTARHLDERLIEQMAAASCIRISVGVETLEDEAAAKSLPIAKQSPTISFDDAARWCRKYGIELNCFVIVGLPGTTVAGTRATIRRIAEAGGRARPTLYTPYHQMHGAMTEREVSAFNRHLFVDSSMRSDKESLDLLDILFRDDDYSTPAIERVPRAPVHKAPNETLDNR
jgi:radical SAM superfamily enzyme YgiQ (UPF0313 family)